ncbi:MAG: serine/threonine-protein kinase [Myxococcota bacterium]
METTLGEGSVAVVYRARHPRDGTTHALKVLKSTEERSVERTLQEARVLARLQHRNIVGITDFVTVGGRATLVMEYVEGGTLTALLRHARLTPDQVDHLVMGVLRGVMAAHDQRVVHRDLKPDNILLAIEGDTLVPKLSDFGLAKVRHSPGHHGPRTLSGTTMGSPAYMAPEQYEDAGEVDERADLFACGAIFFELLAGERAYPGRDPMRLYRDMLAETRPSLPPGLPDRMVRALSAALAPNPAHRPASAAALLDLWFDGVPFPAPEPFDPDLLERMLAEGRGSLDDTLTPLEDATVVRPRAGRSLHVPALVVVMGLAAAVVGMAAGLLTVVLGALLA